MSLPPKGFSYRLAYVRWLRNRGRIEPETDTAFANAIRMGRSWVAKWKARVDAPNQRNEVAALVKGLALPGLTESWLIDGAGTPPQPMLWREWESSHDSGEDRPDYMKVAEQLHGELATGSSTPPAKPAKKKTAAAKRRGPSR